MELIQGIQNTSFVVGDIDNFFHEAMTSIGEHLSAIQKDMNAIKERYEVTNKGRERERPHCEDAHDIDTYTEAMMRAFLSKKRDAYSERITTLLEEIRELQCMLSDEIKSDASIQALGEKQTQILLEAMNVQALKNTVRKHGKATNRDYGEMIEHLDK